MLNPQSHLKLRYNGSYKIEEYGWNLIEESDSDLINVITLGRESQSFLWLKSENLNSDILSGTYRLSTSQVTTSEKYIQTEIFENLKDFEYSVGLKFVDFDEDYYKLYSTKIGNVVDYNFSIIDIENKTSKISISIGTYLGREVLILKSGDSIKDYVFFNWNNLNFNNFKLRVKNSIIYLFVNDNFIYKNYEEIFYFDGSLIFKLKLIFENKNINQQEYINETKLDIDLLEFISIEDSKKTSVENNDSFYSNKDEIFFNFSNQSEITSVYNASVGYDGYDGYQELASDDRFIFIADKLKYFVDVLHPSGDRLSIYKDGKGFLNFEVKKDNDIYKISTSLKDITKNEIYHVAASWSLGNINGDELHLFLNGKEAKNLIKFGSNVSEIFIDKFSDIEKERLQHFSKRVIKYSERHLMSSSTGTGMFSFEDLVIDKSYLGRGFIVKQSSTYPTLVGKYLIIKSIEGNSVSIVDPINFVDVTANVSANDIYIEFPPITSPDYFIKTDIVNSKFTINRTINPTTELGMIIYYIESDEVVVVDSDSTKEIEARVNLTNRTIEFVRRKADCSWEPSVDISDSEVFLNSFGLTIENVNKKIEVSSSTYRENSYSIYNENVSSIKTILPKPINLKDVSLKKIVKDKFIPELSLLSNHSKFYRASFSNTFDYLLSSQKINSSKLESGRYLSVMFDSDNFYHDELNGVILNKNFVKVTGVTVDGSNEEIFEITRNGIVKGMKLFLSVSAIYGELNIIDLNYESAVIQIVERDSIFVQNGSNDFAKLYDYSNGEFFIGNQSETYIPYELTPGFYIFEYSTKLRINNFNLGDRLFVGTDSFKQNSAESAFEDFKSFSDMFEDSRAKFVGERQNRSISSEYISPLPLNSDKGTLSLIPFNNPKNDQIKKLRKAKFLDEVNNISYSLEDYQIEYLSKYLNNESEFVSYLIKSGIDFDSAKSTYYEVHKANNGPIKNIAKFYPNDSYKYRFNSSGPNSNFSGSAKFDFKYNISIVNDSVMIDKNSGLIEFWISPIIDTLNDSNERVYFDSRDIVEEIITSNGKDINTKFGIKELISVTLLKKDEIKSKSDIYDELEYDAITGILNKGTGNLNNFKLNYKLLNDTKISLQNTLLTVSNKVKVRYVSKSSSGDFIRIYKDKYSNLVLNIKTNNNERVVKTPIRWIENSWHKIKFYYSKSEKRIYLFVDGKNKVIDSVYNVDYKDILNTITIGGFGEESSMCRISNLKISRGEYSFDKGLSGEVEDLSFKSTLSINNPVVEDDLTTLLIDFGDNLTIDYRTAEIIDLKNGIFNFDVNVDNGFKVLNDEKETLIEELIKALKPAHTNAIVNISEDRF